MSAIKGLIIFAKTNNKTKHKCWFSDFTIDEASTEFEKLQAVHEARDRLSAELDMAMAENDRLGKELDDMRELAKFRKQQIDEMNRSYEITMREGCGDTGHCTCVPALRKRIEELENTVREEVLKESQK